MRQLVITSVDNARVKEVLRLRLGRARRGAGLFIAEGVREVERARAAGLTLRETFVAPALIADWPNPHIEVSDRVLAKMSYRAAPEGVLAIVETPRYAMPENATLLL